MAHKRAKRWVASGYDRSIGRKRHLGTYATWREAVKAEADWKLRTRKIGQETCDQLAKRWTTDYPRPRESTNLHNKERVQKFARDFRGVRLSDVDRPAARQWALKNKQSLPAVRAMFGDAMRDGLVDSNPFTNLRLPGSKGRKNIVALTEDELVELVDLALDPRMELGEYGPSYRAMVLFAGYVGLRPGELFALRPEDVVGEQVTITRALCSKTKTIGPLKTDGSRRTVVVPPRAADALLQVPRNPLGLLFVSPAGRMWTQSSHHRYWSRLRLLANRPGFDFYELRHAAATMLRERGLQPSDVAQQLGHSDGGILAASLYGHPTDAGARQRIAGVWSEVDGPKPLSDARERKSA